VPRQPNDIWNILQDWLFTHGYDGLFDNDGECACELDDLMPCGEPSPNCTAGYRAACDCGDHDFHIRSREDA